MVGLLVLVMLTLGCGDEGDNNKGASGGPSDELSGAYVGSITLLSQSVATSPFTLTLDTTPSECMAATDTGMDEGVCLTPGAFQGYARLMEVADQTINGPENGGMARIAGVASPDQEAEGANFHGALFDLAEETTFNAWNELWSNYSYKSLWTHTIFELAFQKATVKVNAKYITVLIPAYHQPFTSTPGFDDCVPEAERGASRFSDVDFLPGMTFSRGDYLFCVKDTAEECVADDFKWFDKDSQTLVSERPVNPRTHAWLVNDPVTCSREGDRYSFSVNGIKVAAKLDSKFKLYADFSNGVNSVQWKDEPGAFGEEPNPDNLADEEYEKPFLLYYHEPEGGELTEGSGLDMNFDFDLTDAIFIKGANNDNLAAMTVEQIAANIYTKHDLLFEDKAAKGVVGWDVEKIASFGVDATIKVSGGREPPSEL